MHFRRVVVHIYNVSVCVCALQEPKYIVCANGGAYTITRSLCLPRIHQSTFAMISASKILPERYKSINQLQFHLSYFVPKKWMISSSCLVRVRCSCCCHCSWQPFTSLFQHCIAFRALILIELQTNEAFSISHVCTSWSGICAVRGDSSK